MGADLTGSRWRSVAVEAGDTGYMGLERAVLIDVSFRHARMGGSPLMRVRLAGAFLLHCDLQHANFYGADLRGAVLVGTDLSGACFAGADLTGAVLIDCPTARTDWADCVRPGS